MASTFAVVNLRDGQRRDVAPFLLSNDSFPILENAYLFRGRIERRSCFTNVGRDGRLRGSFTGVTDGAGNFTQALLDGTFSTGIPAAVSSFQVSGTLAGSPVTVTLTDPGGASPVVLLTTNPAVTGTLTRSGGGAQIAIAGLDLATAITIVYFPGLPVMGLKVKEVEAINDEDLIAFDTRWTYEFDIVANNFIFQNNMVDNGSVGAGAPFIWTATDSDLFWTTNYYDVLWATNNIAGFHAAVDVSLIAERDGIRWYVDNTTNPGNPGWSNFNPGLNSTSTMAPTQFLLGGLIILPYKDRLIVLNTLEGPNLAGAVRFSQRARYSQNGTPFYSNLPSNALGVAGGGDREAWSEVEIGKGGFVDAPTQEAIVSAEFIKDTLIVYFERSTWQLVYTSNETLPFVWQKINTELGCESTFSEVPFDRGVFAVGNYGIITTDSVNVQRIDKKIPDEVFRIQNLNNGVKRVYGIRDYNAQLVYWTYPVRSDYDGDVVIDDLTFPNQVLVYNYLDGSWAQFDDSFTCFGYWQRFSDTTWAQLTQSWESANFSWNSQVLQARYPDVIAGNQRGFVFVYSQLQNLGQNSPSIPINQLDAATKVITAPNHNFVVDDFVLLTGIQGITSNRSSGVPNNVIYKITAFTVNTFTVETQFLLPPVNAFEVWSGTYTGGGLITHIPNIFIQTKQYNPFYENGKSVRVNFLDCYADRTTDGEFTAQWLTSSNTSVPIETIIIPTSPEPNPSFSSNQSRIFHRGYTNAFGSFFQNVFTLSDDQMRDIDITKSNIRIHGLIYYVSEAGRVSYDL